MPCHKHEHLQHLGLGFPGLGLGADRAALSHPRKRTLDFLTEPTTASCGGLPAPRGILLGHARHAVPLALRLGSLLDQHCCALLI